MIKILINKFPKKKNTTTQTVVNQYNYITKLIQNKLIVVRFINIKRIEENKN